MSEEETLAVLDAALALAARCHEAYKDADGQLRRRWNQAWFEAIEIDVDQEGTVITSLAERAPSPTKPWRRRPPHEQIDA